MEAATEKSTPCCCFRNTGAWQTGSAPAGPARFGEGQALSQGKTKDLFLKKQNKYSPTKTEVGKLARFTTECFTFALISTSAHDPPHSTLAVSSILPRPLSAANAPHRLTTAPLHQFTAAAHRSGTPHQLCSPPATSTWKQAERQRKGAGHWSFVPSSREKGRSFPWRLFASDPSAPRRGIYTATFSPPLFR